ncbi:MAG TPA: dethiobiotin synthase [Rhodospirillales bacterium]|nr:dethiobiotin synthase [Rhodospirillales bacterium]
MSVIVVSGTDTGLGKTVFAAMLTAALDAVYWKPVQSGTGDGTDADAVARLAGVPRARILPERYVLSQPLSPHRSAELDGVEIDPETLLPEPRADGRPVVVEGAGGLLVPLTRRTLFIDVFRRWDAPVVLCARTALGTINHTLLSVEALTARGIPLLGIAFIGEAMPDSERTIVEFSGARRLGRLPWLTELTAESLRRAFAEHFDRDDFLGGAGNA